MNFIAHIRHLDNSEQPLSQHLSSVGELASEFASKIDMSNAGLVLGLLHDFGKFSYKFQNYLNSAKGRIDPDQDSFIDPVEYKGRIDHSSAGAQYVWENLKNIGGAGQGRLCGQILALCIASHHSGLINCLKRDGSPTFCNRMRKEDTKTNLEECKSNGRYSNPELIEKLENLLKEEFVYKMFNRLRKIVTFPEFANEEYSEIDAFTLGLLVRFLFSCLVDADRIDSAEFENPHRKDQRIGQREWLNWDIAIDRLDQRMLQFESTSEINKTRSKISDAVRLRAFDPQGIYTLTVPTGGGKTLTSLRYALLHAKKHKLSRIFYVVPFTTIIEQNAAVVRNILENSDDKFQWVLEHHSDIEPHRQSWRVKLAAENWDLPIVFTTTVQFLETFFGNGTQGVRRLHQLANSVLIFDEVQTLPIKCVHMFCNVLNFLSKNAGTTAILCTATQPLLNQGLPNKQYGTLKMAPNSELLPANLTIEDQFKRVNIQPIVNSIGFKLDEVKELAIQQMKENGSCLVIVNTKKWARNLYQCCAQNINFDSVFHLSTNQYPEDRKQKLLKVKKRLEAQKNVLCISTQLIEAGVDISFASVIRFLAGLDSIVQASGRCNRNRELIDVNGLPCMGTVNVIKINSVIEPLGNLTDIKIGKEISERVIREFGIDNLLGYETLTQYYKYFFFRRANEMTYPLDNDSEETLFNLLSQNALNPGRNTSCLNPVGNLKLLKQSFMYANKKFEAIDAPSRPVLVEHGYGAKLVKELRRSNTELDAGLYSKIFKYAQNFSINLYPDEFQEFITRGIILEAKNDIYYLPRHYYNDRYGLSCELDPHLAN